MFIKVLLYFAILIAAVTGGIVGWNVGYDKGRLIGQDECLIREIPRGNVKCHYVVKECNKSCPTDIGK